MTEYVEKAVRKIQVHLFVRLATPTEASDRTGYLVSSFVEPIDNVLV